MSATPEQLWQQLTAPCPLRGEGCPDALELQAFALGELAPARRDQIAALVGNCAQCAAGVQLALAAETELVDLPPAPAPGPRSPAGRPGRQGWWLGIGAAVLLGATLSAVLLRAPPTAPVLRGDAPIELQPAPEARIRPPLEFRWPRQGSENCRVQLRDNRGALVFASPGTELGSITAPVDLASGRYQWLLLCDSLPQRGPYGFELLAP